MRKRLGRVVWAILIAGILPGVQPAKGQGEGEPGAAEGAAYARIVDEYMKGNWDDLQEDLAPKNKELAALTGPQKLDVKYLRETLLECRPAWWAQAKANQEFNFHPTVWGRTLRASFDPEQKSSVNISFTNDQASATFKWEAADMDSVAPAEHGFTKGELCDLGIWSSLGMAESWAVVPIQSQVNMNDAAKLKLQRYLNFNGNLVGIYYTTPRARRWGLWLCCAYYLEKYAADPAVNSGRSIGSMFLAEILAHRAKYPSIKLPAILPAENIEENLCLALKNGIEKHPWTLAEDRSLREAARAFAQVNARDLQRTGVVVLPSGLLFALDPAADQNNQPARDEWLKRAMERAAK